MTTTQLLTPEGFRTAAYLEARARMDAKKPKCNPPNRPCKGRCIPPNWKCRATGEGTDSHSRVVAGDPLAGAASIARGRARLSKGLKTGSLTDIQAGRAAIARGVVKTVPGKNLKDKQKLRARVDKYILPVATGLFATWALQKGHEAAKVLFPVYKRGIAKDIEKGASNAIGFVFDRIPVYGSYRSAARRNAALQAQYLGQATLRAAQSNTSEAFPDVVRSGVKVPGLATVINENSSALRPNSTLKTYNEFRGDLLGNVLGAKAKDHSIYSEPAARLFLARQYGVPLRDIRGVNDEERKKYLLDRMASRFSEASDSMRRDMRIRGLDYKKPGDVDRYLNVVTSNSNGVWRRAQLTPIDQDNLNGSLSTIVRDLVSPHSKENSPRKTATALYDDSVKGYDKYFEEASSRVRDNVTATRQVVVSVNITGDYTGSNSAQRVQTAVSPVRTTLIGVAERLKRRVGITEPIAGANHAELILQKYYHERATKANGQYKPRQSGSWMASDADIKFAAQDLGWRNTGGVDGAISFLQQRGFENLASRPAAARTTRRTNPQQRLSELAKSIRARPGNENMSLVEALRAARAEINRSDQEDSVRLTVYNLVREQLIRTDRACGKSYIPDNKKCSKSVVEKQSASPQEKAKPTKNKGYDYSKLLLGGTVLVGSIGLSGIAAAAIDDVVKVRSRQFGEPTFSTFNQVLGDPDKFNNAKTQKLSAGAFGETSFAVVDGKTYVVKNPKAPDKATRTAMGAGLSDKATRNLFRAQGRMTKSEVANARLAAEIGVAPKVVAANRNTLVTEVASGKPAEKLDTEGKKTLHQTLAKLHRAGIAHNDLKPDNFFVDDKGKMQLIDFGLSMRSPSGVAREWYRAMNHNSPNILLKVTGTATGSFNLKELNPTGYRNAERALEQVIGSRVSEEAIIKAGSDPKKARQLQLVINNYYAGKYNYASLRR